MARAGRQERRNYAELSVPIAEKNTATAKILHAAREIEIGDSIVGQ